MLSIPVPLMLALFKSPLVSTSRTLTSVRKTSLALNDPEKHYTLLKELVRKFPNEKWAFHYLGDALYLYRNDFPGAYDQYKKWLELDPQDANAIDL